MPDPEPDNQTILTETLQALRATLDAQKPADEHFVLKTLKQLGTLAISAGVVGAFGKLFGASDAVVASLTLTMIASLYVIIYRETIQRVFKSYMILLAIFTILLVALLVRKPLVSFFLSQTISKSTGIVEYQQKANDFLPRIRDFATKSQEEVWLTGISFYITLPANKEVFLQRLEDGVTVRFLVYNPLSPNLDEVSAGFSQTRQELFSECDVTIQNLRSLLNDSRQRRTKGQLEVRLFSSIPKSRIYIFDRHRETGYTYFIPHIDQQNSPNLPGFLVRNIKAGIAPAYFEGVERFWNISVDFDQFLKTYDAEKQKVLSNVTPPNTALHRSVPIVAPGEL